MRRINDDHLDKRINTEWNELYPGIFAEAYRYVPGVSQNRKEDGENALHTTVERTLERMWLQHYGHEIKHLFYENQCSLTEIILHLEQTYSFRVSEERLLRFLRPPRKRPKQVRKDFSERTPGERKAYVVTGIFNNSLQWLRPYRHASAEILPGKDADATAGDPAEEMEEKDAYTKALQLLPQQQREIMELAEEGYTANEIADKLGIQPNNVRQQRFKARRKIKKIQIAQDTRP